MPDIFQISLTSTSWKPCTVQALQDALEESLERPVDSTDVQFYGVDGAGSSSTRQPLDSDEAVQGFCENEREDGGASKASLGSPAICAVIPAKIAESLKQPRQLAVLTTARQIMKFTAEACGRQTTDLSLKLFECGHFKIKETGPSSPTGSAQPRATVYEGRYKRSKGGIGMVFLLRYQWQQTRRRTSATGSSAIYEGISLEARDTWLDWVDDAEDHLRGVLRPVLGCDEVVDLRAEADMAQQVWSRQREDEEDAETQRMLKAQPVRPRRPPEPPKQRRRWDDDLDDDDPRWPMYLGIFLFFFIFAVFAYLLYEENYGAPDEPREFEEL